LDGEVGVVLAGKHHVGQVIQFLDSPRRVVLTNAKDDGLSDLAA
jgi:hypothetical protein